MEMIYNDKAKRFVCNCAFEERMLPKSAKFRWDPTKKKWWTDDLKKASKLIDYADELGKKLLTDIAEAHKASLTASRAESADIDIPAPDGLTYMPFQKAGISYAMAHPNVLFGDEMGLGKTIQALGVINSDKSIRKILVICPASLRLNWEREARKWLVRDFSYAVIESKKGWSDLEDIIIINYDILKKFHKQIHAVTWDLLIVDECHYLKNGKAQRTQEVMGRKAKKVEDRLPAIESERRAFLSGTPIPNRPKEGWSIFNHLAPDTFKSWYWYHTTFCAGHKTKYGWDIDGASALPELQDTLRGNIMVRRLKKDVLAELPAKVRQIIDIPANGLAGVIAHERAIEDEHAETVTNFKVAVELAKAADDPEIYNQAVANLKKAISVAFTEMSKVRHETALAKVPAVIDHLHNAFEDGHKIILFAHHKDVIAQIRAEFAGQCAVLVGDTEKQERQDAVDRFQSDPNCKLFIGSIGAAGVGITLTASSHVIFAELDWVPGRITQCEDRPHRIGQKNSVLIQHLVIDGSLDSKMAKTLVKKQAVLDSALDIEHPDMIEAAAAEVETEKASTKSVRKEQVAAESLNVTAEMMAATLEGLQQLSAMCDGAREEDGMGFNKIDTRIGKSLAGQGRLSPKQAVLGARLVNKYRRQLPERLVAQATGKP